MNVFGCEEVQSSRWDADFSYYFGGESGIRTHDTQKVYRFSRPALSSAQPSLPASQNILAGASLSSTTEKAANMLSSAYSIGVKRSWIGRLGVARTPNSSYSEG